MSNLKMVFTSEALNVNKIQYVMIEKQK